MKLEDVIQGAIGPFDEYADGYGNVDSSGHGYVSVLKLETGCVKADMDEVLEGIVSYDRAETKGSYVGQINMIAASSFNGLNGVVWGYHVAAHEAIANNTQKPLFHVIRKDGKQVPVYSVEPLLDAGMRLFGTAEKRRFPLLPGAHVKCAVKSKTIVGPNSVWCAIALAIAQDREKDANLFIEDAGDSIPADSDEARVVYLNDLMRKIATSIVRCGEDSNVQYKEIYLGYKTQWIPEGHVGCALTCAPYIVLAKNSLPSSGKVTDLLTMTLPEWEKDKALK